ncbi:MAG: hypothetical protein WBE32_23790, partial [Pseudolabrys sp.]
PKGTMLFGGRGRTVKTTTRNPKESSYRRSFVNSGNYCRGLGVLSSSGFVMLLPEPVVCAFDFMVLA